MSVWNKMCIRDSSKAATIDPNAQLTTAQLQTYGDLSMMEIYRNYHYAFTQQLMGCWNTTNYGGRHTLDNNEMSRIWTSFYTQSLKNIIDAQYRTAEDAEKVNINSVPVSYTHLFFLKTISTFSTKKYGRKKLMNPVGPIKSYRHTMPLMYRLERTGINRF